MPGVVVPASMLATPGPPLLMTDTPPAPAPNARAHTAALPPATIVTAPRALVAATIASIICGEPGRTHHDRDIWPSCSNERLRQIVYELYDRRNHQRQGGSTRWKFQHRAVPCLHTHLTCASRGVCNLHQPQRPVQDDGAHPGVGGNDVGPRVPGLSAHV